MQLDVIEALRVVVETIRDIIPNNLSIIDNTLYLSKDDELISDGINISTSNIQNLEEALKKLQDNVQENTKKIATNTEHINVIDSYMPLKGKSILCLGDSIMGSDQVDGVTSFLAEYSGATVYNGGFAGSYMSIRNKDSDSKCFDLPNLLNAIANGEWTAQEKRAKELNNYFIKTVNMFKKLDLEKIDIITLAYGTNDWAGGEKKQYVLDALNDSIDKIQTEWPKIRILVITPIWRYFGTNGKSGDNYTGYGEGYTLREWAGFIQEAAKNKHISVLNAYENLPISHNNASTYFDPDSSTADGLDHTHLNTEGNKMYAHIINGKLNSIF